MCGLERSPDNSLLVLCGGAVVVVTLHNVGAMDDVVAAIDVAGVDSVVVAVGVAAAVEVWVQ